MPHKGEVFEKAWEVYGEDTASFLVLHEKELRGVVYRMYPLQSDLFEEMWSDLIFRIPRIIQTWNVTRGACLKTHIFGNVKWYADKWVKASNRHLGAHEQYQDSVADENEFVKHQVREYLELLPEFEAWILEMRYIENWSVRELAHSNGWTESGCRRYINDSLNLLRERLNG